MLRLSATMLLIVMVGVLTWRPVTAAREADSWVNHTYQVIGVAQDLGIALRDVERGQRNFLLTGDENFLTPYRDALARIPQLVDRIRALTSDNPEEQQRLRYLASLIDRRLQATAETIRVRRDSGRDASVALLHDERPLHLMSKIDSTLGAVVTTERHLLDERQAKARFEGVLTQWLALGGCLLAIGVLVLAARLLAQSHAQLLLSEAEQRAMADQMRTAFDSVSQGIAVFGPDRRLARWNGTFPLLLGLRAALHPRQLYSALLQPTGVAGSEPLLETEDQIRHGRGGRAPGEPVVYERVTTGGRHLELRRTATPEEGFVLTVTDITERVRAEATARDAQRLQAMGQLTGGIAHDFNNLLTVVLGNLELAGRHLEAGSPVTARIDRAIWGAERGATLTQQLLAFARRQPLVPAAINLSALLSDITNLLRRSLGEHIDIRVIDAAGLWPAMADPTQVETALLNLALNARDAMPGGGRLTLEVANKVLDREYARQNADVAPGNYVMLAVSDTGLGMAEDVRSRAFDPFFSTKGPGQGTGMGLAMVFGFAKQSEGHVKIYSEPGEGTTVRLYLPRAIGNVVPQQRNAAPAELPHGSATILVVEDDTAVREVTATILRDLGYNVAEAENGEAAERLFADGGGEVDLLLVDVVLPGGLRGNEVARRLAETRPGLRVLFMSGYTENAIVHQGRLDDGVQLIGKPFHREQLARKIAELLA